MVDMDIIYFLSFFLNERHTFHKRKNHIFSNVKFGKIILIDFGLEA